MIPSVLNSVLSKTKEEVIDSELGNINVEQKAYDPIWLSEQVSKGNINQESVNIIADIIEVVDSIYPNLWDLQVYKVEYTADLSYKNISGYGLKEFTVLRTFHRLAFKLIIKFPEVEIKNSNRMKHTIKDLYVRIKLHETKFNELFNEDVIDEKYQGYQVIFNNLTIPAGLSGLRGTLTVHEYLAGYLHSHLSPWTNYSLGWGSFCLGEGEIVQTLLLLSQVGEYTTELFTMLLLQIEVYVAWESLSGVPYIKMGAIGKSSTTPLNKLPTLRLSGIEDFINNVKYQYKQRRLLNILIDEPKFDWKMEGKNAVIILNEKLDNFLRVYGNDKASYCDNHIFYQDNEGKYYNVNQSMPTINDSNITKNTFVFQGRVESLKIEKDNNAVTLNPEFIFHPKIKLILKQKLEAYAINSKIRSSITERAIKIANSRGTTKENTVSV